MKEWCKNGMLHPDGKRRFGVLTDGLCGECLAALKPKSNGEQIRIIIAEIRLDRQQTTGKFDLRIRAAFLKIDDLGGYLELKDKQGNPLYDTDHQFLETEFPEFSYQYVQLHRAIARIERALELPVGTYPTQSLEPFRQFRIHNPRGVLGKGTHRNEEGARAMREVWAEACRLAKNDRPKDVHIDKALTLFAEQGKTKPNKKTRTTLDKERYQARKEKQQQEKLELEKYKRRCAELEKELEKARQQILALQYKLQQHPVAV